MSAPHIHWIGGERALVSDEPYGDVRDALIALPGFGFDGYAVADLFPVRTAIIAGLDPAPSSVFEFGSYRGYFLVAALYAAPTIRRVGWIDNELNLPGSNQVCEENVRAYAVDAGRTLDQLWYHPTTRECVNFGEADLVQVDAAHSYTDCLTDLVWALELSPRTIMVDDYTAIATVRAATDDFAAWKGYVVEEYQTVNGLAVLTMA